eukprot:scaffold873_cov111-Isochrysis_galbana.AAC.3
MLARDRRPLGRLARRGGDGAAARATVLQCNSFAPNREDLVDQSIVAILRGSWIIPPACPPWMLRFESLYRYIWCRGAARRGAVQRSAGGRGAAEKNMCFNVSTSWILDALAAPFCP